MTSIVIPAHNESRSIARAIRSVLDQCADAEVVVVANACEDDTADQARRVSREVHVIETETSGKCPAMNLGDDTVESFPRFYMDADVYLAPGSIARLERALDDGVLLVAPESRIEFRRSSLPARLVLQIERRNHFYGGSSAPNGSGVFGVSQSGRRRWDRFPKVLNDDGYVGLHFTAAETAVVPGAVSIVEPPRTFRAMIGPRARSIRGNWELQELFPDSYRERYAGGFRTILQSLASPRLWCAGLAYGSLRTASRFRAWQERRSDLWNQDRSTRC